MGGGLVNMDQFELYFKRADLDQDGRVSGPEAVSFFQASGLPKPVLAQIWTYADQNRSGYLGRAEFYNYLKLVTVAQSKRELTPDIVKAALYGPASTKIPPPQINNLNVNVMVGPAAAAAISQGTSSILQSQVTRPDVVPGGGSNLIIYTDSIGGSGRTLSTPLDVVPPNTSLLQNVAPPKPNAPSLSSASSQHVAGNGFAFGDAISAQARNNSVSSDGGTQLLFQSPTTAANQNHSNLIRHNQQVPVRPDNVSSSQPWPKMSQTTIQKYTKVFMEVDTDRDGKITGEQARNLFLSWKLPRDVLKQVWELSDEDNDSMLSLKEFCIALYLMERFREGCPLPKVLPSNIFEGQTPAPVWRPPPGRPILARPPRPVPVPITEADEQPQRKQQTVPVLEKHLIDQLSTEEQKSLNSKYLEATEADKKVGELEKEILEAKQKIEFYRNKMQEIVLYKSRCDSRLNEITERVANDKREVESLSKKYEEKYKQAGDVASKLTIEEATFRDIQDKKMELYRAIVKLEQDGKPDEIQACADRIQVDLEEQVKTLNERCKMYGLRGKPTSLVELPFGWQSGIQEGAADWDEDWDKFEDEEGFTFVKELTLDVQNVIAPPKSKSLRPAIENKSTFSASTVSSEDVNHNKPDKLAVAEDNEHKKDESPPDSPAAVASSSSKAPETPPNKIFHEKNTASSHTVNNITHSEHSAGEQSFDEAGWGTFDTSYDSDAAWDLNGTKPNKDMDQEESSSRPLFDGGWGGLNPIRTEVPKKATFTFDSVPGTPSPPPGDKYLFQNQGPPFSSSTFADSVPSTPAYSYAGSPRQQPFSSAFADSVPSTPMYATNSPREEHLFTNDFSRFDSFSTNNDGGGLIPPRDSFSRFDSFRSTAQDSSDYYYDQGGFSQPQTTLARFDSMHSTADSDFGHSLFRQPNESFSRFDSMKSANESSNFNHGFPSFDDADPFGSSDPFRSHDPFKTSETPRRDSVDGWKAF